MKDARCRSCEATLLAGARYCTHCGRAVRASGSLPWYIAGASVAALIAFLAVAAAGSGDAGNAAFRAPAGGSNLRAERPPALTGSPIEQADRLFNRVMQAEAAGDTAEARFFLPMAIGAYRNVDTLDPDGLYHLAVLQLAAGEPAAAKSTADEILRGASDHLLALGVAADAAEALGDGDAALRNSRRLLAVFDAESASQRPEYQHHQSMLAVYRADAERRLAGD